MDKNNYSFTSYYIGVNGDISYTVTTLDEDRRDRRMTREEKLLEIENLKETNKLIANNILPQIALRIIPPTSGLFSDDTNKEIDKVSKATIDEYRKLLIGEVEKNNKRIDELLGVDND